MMPKRMKIYLLSLMTLALVPAAVWAMSKVAVVPYSESFTKDVAVGTQAQLTLENYSGRIVVRGKTGAGTIVIKANKRVWSSTPAKSKELFADMPMSVTTLGDVLKVTPGSPDGFEPAVDYDIIVPSSFRVVVATTKGDVSITNVDEVDIASGTGTVKLEQVASIKIVGQSGSVTIGHTPGPIDITTTSGDVSAKLAGDIQSVHLYTASGDVDLGIPEDAPAELGINTTRGSIFAEGLTLKNTKLSQFSVKATIGDGGLPIEITTVSGEVKVRTFTAVKAAPSVAPVKPAVVAKPRDEWEVIPADTTVAAPVDTAKVVAEPVPADTTAISEPPVIEAPEAVPAEAESSGKTEEPAIEEPATEPATE
jgi:hypothetical protein